MTTPTPDDEIDLGALFRARFKAAREAAGLTQADVAHELKTVPQTVQKYEAGKRQLNVSEMRQWARAVGRDWRDFLTLNATPTLNLTQLRQMVSHQRVGLDELHANVQQFNDEAAQLRVRLEQTERDRDRALSTARVLAAQIAETERLIAKKGK